MSNLPTPQGPANAPLLVFLHGWPDDAALWQPTATALSDAYRTVALTWPGFDGVKPPSPFSFDTWMDWLHGELARLSPNAPVTLVLHDWGSVFGMEYAQRHPEHVARVAAVDVGDHNSKAFFQGITNEAKRAIFAYQFPLAIAYQLGRMGLGGMGNALTRRITRAMKHPTPDRPVHWRMNAGYAMTWFNSHGGLFPKLKKLNHFPPPDLPFFYAYGEKKPFHFHTNSWLDTLRARPHSGAQGFATGHWVMLQAPDAYADALRAWLVLTDADTKALIDPQRTA